LEQIFKFYDQKYAKLSNNIVHILRSLDYFTDAEPQKLPEMLVPVSWEEVKKFFTKEVRRVANKSLLT